MKKLLIANRGEVACRIIRSAREMGIATVAVYSEADAAALHVEMADEAREIGPARASDSYLKTETILTVATETGADAIHPGYGFLSENADFAEAVLAAGLTWVGPAPETIRLMGDKQSARRTAEAAGVPVVPGSPRFAPGALKGVEEAGHAVGYPLLVKAASGGGGIGMRQVDGPEALTKTAAMVQEAAVKSFGDGDIYLERYLPRARHVEVQVFGFGDGTAIHLHERDCSLQRRFQKVIEEAPAPGLPEATRDAMGNAALSLCAEVSYSGAGTVEFILDAATGEFFFLEMNTRIQVEHPVTEMVTGRDLVAMQLELARTGDVKDRSAPGTDGWSIECRLYAENPAKKFFPSPGKLTRFDTPAPRPDLRIETGFRVGDTVSPYYDPLIAKIVTHGSDRTAAITRAVTALRETKAEGIVTNREFLIACLASEGFAAGDVHTRFIDDHGAALLEVAAAETESVG
ncbi:acetyl-CoA carboxylase biotin carboxylase subunit [Alterinioella nitratireducens]|uniref:acetyl-CoA carboxylase biotin carboxylase subunit n=1 Tax=Alterinioella nitratireducens TaxID=2735915 RepID=UPI004059A160